MTYKEIIEVAKDCMGFCKACPICNGKVCKNSMPGPGAKGIGDVAIRNYDKWREIRLNMDTICSNEDVDTSFELFGNVDTSFELFGKKFKYPIFAGPVGAVQLHYGDKYTEEEYNDILVKSCAEAGIAAFTGDGTNPNVMIAATTMIKKQNGIGVPTVADSNAFAVAMDVDAAGLPFLKNLTPKAGSKTVDELKQIKEIAQRPFIIKGIMTVKGAKKAVEAGADAIIVSNHGGRVLDQCPSTAEVLPEIADAVKGKI